MTWRSIVAGIVVLILGACASPSRVEPQSVASEEPGYSDASGTPLDGGTKTPRARCSTNCASDFSVTTFTGERFSLAQHSGKVVVLNFWESW